MLQRAYSLLSIKSVNESTRTITGIATTPTPDRMGDIVESQGATFSLPIPLLWQHDSDQPVGQVTAAKVSPSGIEVTCEFVKGTGQPTLDDRLDQAWASVKSGLVRGLSIGFMPKESAQIDGTWSSRFTKWEWLELSAVTIPANSDASITQIRSLDRAQRGVSSSVVKFSTKGKTMNIAARIAQTVETRAAKAAEATAIMEGADGRTLNEAEQTQFDGLSAEVDALDADLIRLRSLERMSAASAVPVDPATTTTTETGSTARASVPATPKGVEVLEPGIRFARVAHVKALAMIESRVGNVIAAPDLARRMYPTDEAVFRVVKAAVDVATSGDSMGGALVGSESTVYADFAEFLRPQTIVGRFGQGGIPSLLAVPFRVRLLSQTSGASAGWVGEARGAGLTRFSTAVTTLTPLKIAAISTASVELIRDSSPRADTMIRNELAKSCAERLDRDFLNPALAASANVSPASITHGVSASVSSGPDAGSIRQDIGSITDVFIAANLPLRGAVFIMSQRVANKVSLMRNALGQREFPDISPTGGRIEGYPVITSEWVSIAGTSNGDFIFLVSADDIYVADDGETAVDMSTEASLEMVDAPTQDASAGTGASLVSMFQTNSVAFRATRTINWALRRTVAVQALDNVMWGDASS